MARDGRANQLGQGYRVARSAEDSVVMAPRRPAIAPAGPVVPALLAANGSLQQIIANDTNKASRPVKLELPNKITLSREDYLTVQQIYRGWALLGFVVAGALLSNLILTIMVRTQPKAVILTLIAFLCIVGTQVVFWTFTYPANQETSNWTMLPAHWL